LDKEIVTTFIGMTEDQIFTEEQLE